MNQVSHSILHPSFARKAGDGRPASEPCLLPRANVEPDGIKGPDAKTRPRKIPPEMRRDKIDFSREPVWYKRVVWRLKEDSQFLRTAFQGVFVLLCLWIGVEFYFFMQWGLSGGERVFVERPPGVEGFLPISALMSLKYWITEGVINTIHPSAMIILLAIIGVSLVLKKSFCSWLCPIGTLSESLWMFGERIFGRTITVTRWLDYPLRSLKYLLLLYFAYSIWQMDSTALATFIYSPYNRVADIKMYLFFAEITEFALWTIIVLMVFSVVIKNFWCRFLCPYGALLGVVGWLSPLKITRNKITCVDCNLCTKACPSNIKVHKTARVWSDECMSCLACVEVCPVKDTLALKSRSQGKPVRAWVAAAMVAIAFVTVTGAAMITGHWKNQISDQEYLRRFQQLESPVYQHFRGQVPAYGPND